MIPVLDVWLIVFVCLLFGGAAGAIGTLAYLTRPRGVGARTSDDEQALP